MSDTVPPHARKRQPRLEPIFYTYILYRNDTPFYVGKGSNGRIHMHESCALNHPNCKHQVCRIIRKEWREGRDVIKEKIAEDIPEQAAFDLERFFIAIGAIYNWPLVNKTVGGEGTSGFRRTMSPEERERDSQRTRERLSKPEEREKLRLRAREYWTTPEAREQQRQRTLRRFSDPEEREKHKQRMQALAASREVTDEEREKRRQDALQQWSDPQFRELRSQQMKERWSDPEEIERQRAAGKERWNDPAYLEKMAERYTPEVLARMSKARSEGDPNHVGTFEGFIDPQGAVYAPVVNLTAFCREHNLSYCGMWLVAKGKQTSHKGWTLFRPSYDDEPAQGTLF